MALEAAAAGLGIGVLPSFAVDEDLRQGRVVEAFPDSRIQTGKSYWLAYPHSRRDLPPLQAFRRWLSQASDPYRNSTDA